MIQLCEDELLDALEAHARAQGIVARRDSAALTEALEEARTLAAGRPEDEPVALFFAFGRRSARFGPAAGVFIHSLARAQATGIGRHLDASDAELLLHRARILRQQIEFPELRGWFAARLRPFGDKPTPPRRPR